MIWRRNCDFYEFLGAWVSYRFRKIGIGTAAGGIQIAPESWGQRHIAALDWGKWITGRKRFGRGSTRKLALHVTRNLGPVVGVRPDSGCYHRSLPAR